METLKKPETIITLINTAALLGASVYFYRRINGLEQEIDKYSEHLTSTIKKVKEMQITKQHVKQLAAAIRELNNAMGAQRNELSYLRNLSSFQREQIQELQEQSKELGADCKLTQVPFQQQNRYNQGFPGYNGSQQGVQQQISQQTASRQGYQPGFNQPGFNQTPPTPQPQQRSYNPAPMMAQRQYSPQQMPQPQIPQMPQQMSQPQMPQQMSQPQYHQQGQNQQGQFQGGYNQPGTADLLNLELGNMNNYPQVDQDDDDLDSEIDAVRRARNQGSQMEMNNLGL